MIESVRSEKGPENEGTPFPLWMEQCDLAGRGWVPSGSLVSFFKARSEVKRLDGLSVDGSPMKINSQANQ